MNFASWTFVLLFLPLVVIAFHTIRGRSANAARALLLVVASLLFYGVSGPHNLLVLGCGMLVNFAAGKLLTARVARPARLRKAIMWTGIAFNVALLSAFKIAALDAGDDEGFRAAETILIPLALSYVTFQQIGFVVACYKRRIEQFGALDYLFFVAFFPQLVLGPIVRFQDISAQLAKGALRKAGSSDLAVGLSIFTFGLAQKVILADQIAPAIDGIFHAARYGAIHPAESWFAIVGFQLQLYFDFAGYADMAIGLGRMFGIRLPINFDRPLFATDRFDIWRRWHITFAVFMRTHVFLPLVRRWHFSLPGALAATGILSGLWHGLGWTFVLWGLVQTAILLVVHARNARARRTGRATGAGRIRAIALTFLTSALVGGLFRAPTLDGAANIYGALTGLAGAPGDVSLLGPRALVMLPLCALAAWGLPSSAQFFRRYWNAIDSRPDRPPLPRHWLDRLACFRLNRGWAAMFALLFAFCLLLMGDARRFIYVQF